MNKTIKTTGLTHQTVVSISRHKSEPKWMLQRRLQALKLFQARALPTWGADLSQLDFSQFRYYRPAPTKPQTRWQDLPPKIRTTFEKLGLPQAEQEALAGIKAQYDSEIIYSSLKQRLARKGVVFVSMEEGVQQYPQLVRQYFGRLVPPQDNKFAALNTAVWSGGSFIYVPPKVKVAIPLQAYFRINSPHFGQFERTLIIADEGSFLHYIEGCTAPTYSSASLHAAVVEIFVKPRARVRYTTIQNWSTNVYNLVTKRAWVEEEAVMEWVDGNLGSKVTMKYPCCILAGPKAHGEMLSLALASHQQHQDTGAKMIHLAPQTSSQIVAKSIAKDGGRTSYRGLVKIAPRAEGARSQISCDALILDPQSRSDTYPLNQIETAKAIVEHEATVSQISQDQLFYLTSRGFDEMRARALIVAGFIQPLVKQLPLEYAVELNRLIELEMEGAVG